jgi:hypothetical protein
LVDRKLGLVDRRLVFGGQESSFWWTGKPAFEQAFGTWWTGKYSLVDGKTGFVDRKTGLTGLKSRDYRYRFPAGRIAGW